MNGVYQDKNASGSGVECPGRGTRQRDQNQEMVSRCEVGFTPSFPPLLLQCLAHGPEQWFSTTSALKSPYAPRPNPERLGIDLGGCGDQYCIPPGS